MVHGAGCPSIEVSSPCILLVVWVLSTVSSPESLDVGFWSRIPKPNFRHPTGYSHSELLRRTSTPNIKPSVGESLPDLHRLATRGSHGGAHPAG